MSATACLGVDALAADGEIVHIRPLGPDDAEALRRLHLETSDQNRYLRFFTSSPAIAESYVNQLIAPDPNRLALLAERDGHLLGVASAHEIAPGEAEIAFLIEDHAHGTGLATLLLEHMAAAARARGIRRFHADVLTGNHSMLSVFSNSGFDEHSKSDGSVVEIVLDTELVDGAVDRILERERNADQHSLVRVLAPRSIAVVGASRRPEAIGHTILRNILDGGFTGTVHPVNPKAQEICGLQAWPDVCSIPEPIDLAVLAVPPAAARTAVADCARAGVAGIVVTTAGFGEIGPAGTELQRELVAIARRNGIRLIGPNCLGVLNSDPDVRLNATFAPLEPVAGGLSLASQSGAVGIAVLDHATRTGLGIAQFVSLGNKADVSGNDLLLHWWRDERTQVIGLYLESFGNPRKFARIARRVGLDKPVLVVKGGRSAGGARGGASHTAAAATPETVLQALFAQSGVIRLDSLPELVDVARVLADQPLPAGRRIAIVGNAGGAGILAADAAAASGLDVPALSAGTQDRLHRPGVSTVNPVDLGAAADASALADAVQILASSGEVDAVLVVVAATSSNDARAALRAAADVAARHPGITVIASALGVPDATGTVHTRDVRLPVFNFPEDAVRALGHVATYATWRRRPHGAVPVLPDVDLAAARAAVAKFLADNPDGGWLPPARAFELLGSFGLPTVPTVEVTNPTRAASAARRLGMPVALKTGHPTVLHKSDVGAVRLRLPTANAVRSAWTQIAAATGDDRVLVQPMAAAGVEMIVGLTRDPLFGPVIMLGTGGVLTDLLADRAWRGLPLTDLDAEQMLDSLKGAQLLAGFRGAPAADRAALLTVLHRVALLGEALPEVAELDLNPVVAGPDGATVVDARIRLAAPACGPDPSLRRLS